MPAHKRNQREKGVALLFSLGILGLMTVLALTFASVSMTSQQTAKNATNKASARFLASSIPVHIASLLYQDAYFTAANTPALAHMPLYSKTQSGTKSYDWIWKLAIRDASLKSAIYEMDVPNYATPEQNPTWQYISRKEDGEDKIVARIAYVAVPSEALIDLNSTLLMEDGTQPTAYTRRGISICGELEPLVLFNQIPKESGEGETFNYFGENLDKAKTGASQDRFTSYDDIQRYIKGDLAADVLKQFNRHFIRAFAPNSIRYPEVFTLPGTTEVYHRIDLVQLSKKIAVLKENSKRQQALNASGEGNLHSLRYGQEHADSESEGIAVFREQPSVPDFERGKRRRSVCLSADSVVPGVQHDGTLRFCRQRNQTQSDCRQFSRLFHTAHLRRWNEDRSDLGH